MVIGSNVRIKRINIYAFIGDNHEQTKAQDTM